MSGKFLARVLAMSLALILAACGGDDSSTPLAGGSNGGNNNTGGGDSSSEVTIGTLQIIANPTQAGTSSTASSSLTVVAKDSNGILLEGVDISFSANNNGALQIDQGTTNASGVARATLSLGDPRNRAVTVTATASGVSDSVTVNFIGTGLAIAGPTSISFGDQATYRITLTDSDGAGIRDEAVFVDSNLSELTASTLTTGANGVVDVTLEASNTSGSDTITATAYSGGSEVSASRPITIAPDSFSIVSPSPNAEVMLNTTAQVMVEWLTDNNAVADGKEVRFSTTRGSLTPSDGAVTTVGGEASVGIVSTNSGPALITAIDPETGLETEVTIEFVADTPDSLNLQAEKTQLDLGASTEITATVRDAENNLVKGQTVNFVLLEDGSNGTLSASVAETNSQGRARVTYTGGTASSGRDGVEIGATVAGSVTDSVMLTVARQALRLAIGTGNEIFEPDSVRYRAPYIAIVTDANGAPVSDADIELSVLPLGFRKGEYAISPNDTWVVFPAQPIFCESEDINDNGVLDENEDRNGNGRLEPTNSATTSSPSVISASDGSADFDLLYPQNHCKWVEVRLTATVEVGGTESIESADFFLPCSADDLDDTDVLPPGGIDGLYGKEQECLTLD